MVTPEQGTIAALRLVERGAELLDEIGDKAGALRLWHARAIVKADARYPAAKGFATSLSLMKMALAILDCDGHYRHEAAIYLQTAIDCACEAAPLQAGEEVDPHLVGAYLDRGIA